MASHLDSRSRQWSLVYEHKAGGRNFVPHGLSLMEEEDLVKVISKHEDITVTIKPIQPGVTSCDIFKVDLLSENEKRLAMEKTSTDTAEVEEVPWRVFFGHEWEGHSFDELVILTPKKAMQKPKTDEKGK